MASSNNDDDGNVGAKRCVQVLDGKVSEGYELTVLKDLDVGLLFCDYYRNNLETSSSWTKNSRERLRAKNVVEYMQKLLTEEQKAFLRKPQPSKETPGSEWTTWNQTLKNIGRDVTSATMLFLRKEEERCREPGGKEKSKQGAKVTQTVVAVDGRISKIKSALTLKSSLSGIRQITTFTSRSVEQSSPGQKRALSTSEIASVPAIKKVKYLKPPMTAEAKKRLSTYFKPV